jgi:N-hydroxyarylamine O-acetyltransferase
MDVQTYLERIDFEDTIALNKNILFKLQKKHLLNIPFENLDIHYNRKINLSLTDIYQKIIKEKRGGFCYELNGLFHDLLRQIGFDAKLISARVFVRDNEYSPEYDHLAIIVNVENSEFLVDVGFGKFSLEPLKLEMGQMISDSFGKFQFDKYDKDYYRINEIKDNNLLPQYIFKNKERKLSEFAKRCEFHQTSQNSHFTKKKLISIAKADGRITLNNAQLKITRYGIEEEINFDENEFESKLKQYFDIEI